VVVSCTGPFALNGDAMVNACVRFKTDYCDITGETWWVRGLIDNYHDVAKKNGTNIVPMCGCDSIPSDIGTHYLVTYMKDKNKNADVRSVRAQWLFDADLSGGTYATMMELWKNKSWVKAFMDPYILNPDRKALSKASAVEEKDEVAVRYDRDAKAFTSPFIMAAMNTRVVRRSAALLAADGKGYGPEFTYNEIHQHSSFIKFVRHMIYIVLVTLLMMFSFGRVLLKKFYVPAQGSGPSRKKLDSFYFHVTLKGKYTDKDEKPVVARIDGGDPGYVDTAKMVAEAAMCLAKERIPGNGGVLTPATAFGNVIVDRLNNVGVTFQIVE